MWVLRMSGVDDAEMDLSMLDTEERRRASKLSRPPDRLSYVAAHILLRQLLSERLSVRPHELAFVRETCPACGAAHGRPALDHPLSALHFSLSRSGDVALIGISATRVGVDVEAVPGQETVAEVSGLLHPAERDQILSAVPSERAVNFARLWTRKEAYLKGIGVGITNGLAAENVARQHAATDRSGWAVFDAPAPAGYAAAAAVSARGPERLGWRGVGGRISVGSDRGRQHGQRLRSVLA